MQAALQQRTISLSAEEIAKIRELMLKRMETERSGAERRGTGKRDWWECNSAHCRTLNCGNRFVSNIFGGDGAMYGFINPRVLVKRFFMRRNSGK